MRLLASALIVTLVGCGADDAPATDAAVNADAGIVADAPPGRPWGVIDGACTGQPGRPRVLVYSRENLWRHLSNFYARLAIYDMCTTRGFNVLTTNDPLAINAARLSEIDVVVFAITSGPGIDDLGRADFEAWMRAGHGMVGLHSASATEPEWPFYVDRIGASFRGHVPGMQPATVTVEPGAHPITDGLAPPPVLTDEWYFFQGRPEDVAGQQMLLSLDEASLPADYPAEYKVGYHPIGWARDDADGRVFYTALGHNPDAWSDPWVLELVGRSIEWAARQR